jgi:hypothetical protein
MFVLARAPAERAGHKPLHSFALTDGSAVVAYALNLYYLSFRDIVEWALRNGYHCYRTAPFNYDPKLHLRLDLEAVDLFVRDGSPLFNFLIRKFAPRFAPGQSDPVLRRHFADQL